MGRPAPDAALPVNPIAPIESPRYSLSIWGAFDPPNEMLFNATESQRQVIIDPGGAVALVERVYVWSVQDDPLAGVVDVDARTRLQARLDSLKIDEPCRMRTIADLQSLVDEARRILGGPMVSWSPSLTPTEPRGEGHRLNSLLAFTKHLEWLIDVFKDVPHTWVSLR